MGDVGKTYKAYEEHKKRKRRKNLKDAESKDDGEWDKHTPYHWSREVSDKDFNYPVRIDYWPTKNKWQYRNKMNKWVSYQF